MRKTTEPLSEIPLVLRASFIFLAFSWSNGVSFNKIGHFSRFLWSLIWVCHADIMCSDLHFRNYVRALEHEKWGAPEPFRSLTRGHQTGTSLTHPPALWLGSVTTQLTWPPALSRRFLKIWSEKCTAVVKMIPNLSLHTSLISFMIF